MSVGMGTLVPEIDRATWICILVVTSLAINWFGVRVTTRISGLSVIAQILVVLAVLALCTIALYKGAGLGGLTHAPFFSGKADDLSKIFSGASVAVLAFLGFDAISTLSEEVHGEDRRMIGRATLAVLLIAGTLFVLSAWVLGNLMPAIQMQDPAAAIFELLGQTIGPWAAIALAWFLALVVGFTNVLPTQVGVARVLFAMGRDKQLPSVLARLHPRHGSPYIAMLVSTGISMAVALALRDNVELLASLVNFGALVGFMLLHLSVLVQFAKGEDTRWFVHKAVPLLGLVVVLAVFSGMQDVALKLGSAWLVVGVVYGMVLRRKGRMSLEV
jgi:amino acid transporter